MWLKHHKLYWIRASQKEQDLHISKQVEESSDVCISPEVPVLPQAGGVHILPRKLQAHSLPLTGMRTVVSLYKSLETASVNIPWEQDVSELLLAFHKLPICPSHHSRQAFSWGICLSFPRPSTALTFLLPPPLTSKDPMLWENHLPVLPCPHDVVDSFTPVHSLLYLGNSELGLCLLNLHFGHNQTFTTSTQLSFSVSLACG